MKTNQKEFDYIVVILSHGRADKLITLDTLRKCGYNGEVAIIIDDEDEQGQKYHEYFDNEPKCRVVCFNKKESLSLTDMGDNIDNRGTVVLARNKSYDLVRDMGYRYFVMLEDDYTSFENRWVERQKNKLVLRVKKTTGLDDVFNQMFNLLSIDDRIKTTALFQGGDLIGGAKKYQALLNGGVCRKAMNVFFMDVDKPVKFKGRMNDDVNAYITQGSIGSIFLSVPGVFMVQRQTQSSSGGLTDMYLRYGTYVKSFYSVMYAPSCVSIGMMGDNHLRIHHHIYWNNAVPKIISDKYRK